jgi:hypothetical protein
LKQDLNIADCEEELQDSPLDILQRLPGMTSENCQIIMSNVTNLFQLSQMNVLELGKLIGKKTGQTLFDFFNQTQ